MTLPLQWDPRLDAMDIQVVHAQPAAGETCYRLVKAKWLNEAEAGGRHHIYVDVLDEGGKRIVGQRVLVTYGGQTVSLVTEDKPYPELSSNFPMYAVLGMYSCQVEGVSDVVTGLGMGSAELKYKLHTCFELTFQREKAEAEPKPAPKPEEEVKEEEPVTVEEEPVTEEEEPVTGEEEPVAEEEGEKERPLFDFHYVLLGQTVESIVPWAWIEALRSYLQRFRVTMGFSHDHAMMADNTKSRHVTIIGSPDAAVPVSEEAEAILRASGAEVDRVLGTTAAEIKAEMDRRAATGRRFG